MSRSEHRRVQDPADRFCGQCGARRVVKDSRAREGRCGDCADHPVGAQRFCRTSGARLDPPPLGPRSPLSSYLGPIVEVATCPVFRGIGPLRLNEQPNEYSQGRT